VGDQADVDSTRQLPAIKRQDRKLIGINLSPYFGGELLAIDKETMSGWVNFFSKLIVGLEKSGENEAIFVMTQSFNEWMVNDISKILGRDVRTFGPSTYGFHELRHLISQLDVYLTMRMHGAIFALSAGVPAIGLCFTEKLRNFYADYGLEEFQIDLKPKDYGQEQIPPQLMDTINHCVNLPKSKKNQLKSKMAQGCARQDQLFESIKETLE
jgi:hypothetical protein